MTSKNEKIRSLFLTALMVFSVFAGTVAISGTAAGNVGSFGSATATDVQADQGIAQQTVTIQATSDGDGGTDTISITSDVPDAVSGSSVVDSSISGDGSIQSASLSEVVVEGLSDTNQYTVTLTVEHDTTGVNAGDEGSYTFTAEDESTTTANFDFTNERFVPDEGTLFQGEDDFQLGPNDLSPGDLERTSGDSQGVVLEEPIATDAPTGSYAETVDNNAEDFSVTVQTPRVSDLEIQNDQGADIAGGTLSTGNEEASVVADWNFGQSEALEVTIEDEDGIDVTNQVLAETDTATTTDDPTDFNINVDALDSGTEYTVTVEGADDLDFGEASQSTTFTLSSDDSATLNLDQDEATRGEDVRYEITGADEESVHPILIEGADITAGDTENAIRSAFRNVGDTVAVTNTVDNDDNPQDAVALVEIDDGVGVGQIETGSLDEASVDATLYDSLSEIFGDGTTAQDVTPADLSDNLGPDYEADDETLEVTEGAVELTSPSGSYVVGSEININGTTTQGVSDVVLYVRDEGDYKQLTEEIDVEGDETFEEEDIVISDEDGEDLIVDNTLQLPGTYRLAVVDAASQEIQVGGEGDNTDENGDDLQDIAGTSEISSAVSSQYSLDVTDTSLNVEYVSIINGQVAEDDTLTVRGTAAGQDEVSISFYGPRGSYDRTTASVDSNGEFDEDNIGVGNNDLGNTIDQGNVVMSVYTSGRDGLVGDGEITNAGGEEIDQTEDEGAFEAAFVNFYQRLNDRSLTQQQVIDRVASETTEDTGSDDISEIFQFRNTDSQTSIQSTSVENGELMIEGVTNRQPDDNDITIEVIDGPSSSGLSLASTDEWGTDGQWNVTLDVSDADTGNYTVEADDGANTDIASFQLTEDGLQQEPTDTPDEEPGNETETEPEPDPTETEPEPTETEEQTDEQTEQQTEEQTEQPTTTEGGPGFTAVVALVALVAAALLAVRRRD